jgi:hypothetical protein
MVNPNIKETDLNVETKFKLYYNMEIMDLSITPLVFYQNHSRFSALFTMSERLFSIPATSTSSERAFSTMGRIVTKIRCKIHPETAGNLLFLKENNDFW